MSNVPLPLSPQKQPASNRSCGNAYCSSAFRSSATVDEGKLTPARHADRTGHEPFPKQAALVVAPRLDGPTPLSDSRSDLMHSQYRLSVLRWKPGPARKNDTQIIPAVCGRFHVVILQEARDHVSHIAENFYT